MERVGGAVLVEELFIPHREGTVRVRLDEHLTVVAGLDDRARARLIGLLVGALAGEGPGCLQVRDALGEPALISRAGALDRGGRTVEGPVPAVVPTAGDLERLMVVRAADLGLDPGRDDPMVVAERTATMIAHRQLVGELAAVEAGRAERIRLQQDLDRCSALAEGVASQPRPQGRPATADDAGAPGDERSRALERRRAVLRGRLSELPDADELHRTLRQLRSTAARLERLESRAALDPLPDVVRVRNTLLGRAAALRPKGVHGVAPLLLDDPLLRLDPDRRCELLDLMARVSQRTQVVMLTDDAVVTTWAQHGAHHGRLRLIDLNAAASA